MLRIFLALIYFIVAPVFAAAGAGHPLPPNQAFQLSTSLNKQNQLILEWKLAPSYYLYRNKININLVPGSNAKIDKIQYPATKAKVDKETGTTYQVYYDNLKIPVTFVQPVQGVVTVNISYQGCSSQGFCYAPQEKTVRMDMTPNSNMKNVVITGEMQEAPPVSKQDYAERVFANSSDFVIILTFLGLGLLLAFTPCVLPMVPILSGIILGHKHITTAKAFFLSLAYVMGMAITYAIAGMIVAMLGSHIQTFFQSTWMIVFISVLFFLLSLSLFGLYELELPSKWQRRLTNVSNKQKSGTYIGVFLMGVLSSLIVSPCVSAPLVGVLAYIAKTGDVVLGGSALLALGFGMGIPLLLIGVSAKKLVPKSGAWMEGVKKFFGILLVAVAISMVSRVIAGPLALFLWALLFAFVAKLLGLFSPAKTHINKASRALGFVAMIYGVVLVVGAVLGNGDPLHPLQGSSMMAANKKGGFVEIKDMTQLESELAEAKRAKMPVMVDFYADWCVSCVEIDRTVFARSDVQDKLAGFKLLRANVTSNDEFDQALLKRFNVVAPPTMLFFTADGDEINSARLVGEVNEQEFLDHLQQINLLKG